MSQTPLSSLSRKQLELTQYLRDPDHAPAPPNLELRRLNVYQELIFNNIEGFLTSGFPVLHRILSEDQWRALVALFVARHRALSPYFLDIGQEFFDFVQHSDEVRANLPRFTVELMHYERAELALDVSTEVLPTAASDDLVNLASLVSLSPLAWPLAYQYPVQKIGPDFQPDTVPELATYLLVYRDRHHTVRFMELNGLSYALLASLQDSDLPLCTQSIIDRLHDLVHGQKSIAATDVFADQALGLLQRFVDQDIVHIC